MVPWQMCGDDVGSQPEGRDPTMRPADRPSGLDGGALLALADRRDLDLAGTRLLSHRDGEAEHAGAIGRLDSVEVQVVTQHQLATEGALAAFGGEHLPVEIGRAHV